MKRPPFIGRLPDTVQRFVDEAERTPNTVRLQPLVPPDPPEPPTDDEDDVTEPPVKPDPPEES